VRLVADEATIQEYLDSTHFMLASAGPWHFDLGQYARMKPIFDWLGVRYLVLDRAHFWSGSRQDHRVLTESPSTWRVAYEDARVVVVESLAAERRAELWSTFTVEDDQSTILAQLRADPASIGQAPRVEAAQVGGPAPAPVGQATRVAVPLASYRPNEVVLRFDAPTAGLLVLKDVHAEGWNATLDGEEARVIRVNGLVRGVLIPTTGPHEVRFTYLPEMFVAGALLSPAIAVLLVAAVAAPFARLVRRRPRAVLAAQGVHILR